MLKNLKYYKRRITKNSVFNQNSVFFNLKFIKIKYYKKKQNKYKHFQGLEMRKIWNWGEWDEGRFTNYQRRSDPNGSN